MVGAVFNRDYPGNRGRRPLPQTINLYLNGFEYSVVSKDRFLWPKNGQSDREINFEKRISNIE